MDKATSLRCDAAKLEREARTLQRRAERLAKRGCVFTAEQCSLAALAHQRMAAQFRVSAINHETA